MMSEVKQRHMLVTPSYRQHERVNGLTKKLKFKFCEISGIFELALDRFTKFITKGLICCKFHHIIRELKHRRLIGRRRRNNDVMSRKISRAGFILGRKKEKLSEGSGKPKRTKAFEISF